MKKVLSIVFITTLLTPLGLSAQDLDIKAEEQKCRAILRGQEYDKSNAAVNFLYRRCMLQIKQMQQNIKHGQRKSLKRETLQKKGVSSYMKKGTGRQRLRQGKANLNRGVLRVYRVNTAAYREIKKNSGSTVRGLGRKTAEIKPRTNNLVKAQKVCQGLTGVRRSICIRQNLDSDQPRKKVRRWSVRGGWRD
jgi:hypothetical protein